MRKQLAWVLLFSSVLFFLIPLAANQSARQVSSTGTLSMAALQRPVFVRLDRGAGSPLRLRYALEDSPCGLGVMLVNTSSFSLYARDTLLYSCKETDPVRAAYVIPIPDELMEDGTLALTLETPYVRRQTTLCLGVLSVLERLAAFRQNVEIICVSLQLFLILISLLLYFSKPSERYLLALCLLLLATVLLRLVNSMAASRLFTHRSNKFLLPALGLFPTFLEISLYFRLIRSPQTLHGLFWSRLIVLAPLFCCLVGFLFPDQYTIISLLLNTCVLLLTFTRLLTIDASDAPGAVLLTVCFGIDLGLLLSNQALYLLPPVHTLAHLSFTTLSAMIFETGACIFVLLRFSAKFSDAERLSAALKTMNAELDQRAMQKAQELTRERADRHRMMINIFHDLRSPLYVASECARFIGEGESAQYLPLLTDRLDFMNRLVEDLFLIAKMEDDDFLMVMDTVDLSDIFRRQCEIASLNAEKTGITFTCSCAPGILVWGDPYRIEQVLQNLIQNAFVYTPVGKSVTATLAQEDGRAVFCIRDTGSGISEEDLPNIFTKYYRVNRARNPKSTGLGLSIANEIMRYHHGTLRVESRLGEGTAFTGVLPVLP